MKKRLILLMLLIVNLSISASALEKASNSFVKEARQIILVAYGNSYRSDDPPEDNIIIKITGFWTNEWNINIKTKDGVILDGTFYIYNSLSRKLGGIPQFGGHGINNITDEELDFDFICNDHCTYIFFDIGFDKVKQEIIKPKTMQLNSFMANPKDEYSKILFARTSAELSLNSALLKYGTPKQLKKLMLKCHPNLKKV